MKYFILLIFICSNHIVFCQNWDTTHFKISKTPRIISQMASWPTMGETSTQEYYIGFDDDSDYKRLFYMHRKGKTTIIAPSMADSIFLRSDSLIVAGRKYVLIKDSTNKKKN